MSESFKTLTRFVLEPCLALIATRQKQVEGLRIGRPEGVKTATKLPPGGDRSIRWFSE